MRARPGSDSAWEMEIGENSWQSLSPRSTVPVRPLPVVESSPHRTIQIRQQSRFGCIARWTDRTMALHSRVCTTALCRPLCLPLSRYLFSLSANDEHQIKAKKAETKDGAIQGPILDALCSRATARPGQRREIQDGIKRPASASKASSSRLLTLSLCASLSLSFLSAFVVVVCRRR